MIKRNEISTLYRTYSPAFNSYEYDGKGRDTYIGYNQGGFWKARIAPGTSFESCYTSPSDKYKFKYPNKAPVIFKYHSDGSGRDYHVLKYSTDGGLSKQDKSLNCYQLTDFLRNYETDNIKYSLVQKKGFSRNKIYLSKEEKRINNLLLKNQKNVINRLYNQEKYKFMPKMYIFYLFI